MYTTTHLNIFNQHLSYVRSDTVHFVKGMFNSEKLMGVWEVGPPFFSLPAN